METKKIKSAVFLFLLAVIPIIAFVPYVPIGDFGFSADDSLFLLAIASGLAGLILIWVRGECIKRKDLFPANVIFAFAALIAASVFSCLYNSQNFGDFCSMFAKGPVRFLLTLFFTGIIFYYLDSEKKIKIMLLAILAASAAESLFGIGAFLFSWQGPFNIGIASSRAYSALSGIVSGRVNGTFGSVMENFTGSNLLSSYLAILIPISIAFIMILKKNWQKILLGYMLASQLVCLVLTYTRTSIVFVFLSVLIFAWLIEKNKKVIVWALATLLILVVFIPGLLERFSYDSTDRLDVWKSAALVVKDYPLWGVGPGKYLDEISGNLLKYQVLSFDTESLTPHNFFLYAWTTMGAFAVIAMMWIVCEIGKDLRQGFKNAGGENKIMLTGILAGAAGFLMQNFTNNFFFVPSVATYFWVLYAAGISLVCHPEVREATKDPLLRKFNH